MNQQNIPFGQKIAGQRRNFKRLAATGTLTLLALGGVFAGTTLLAGCGGSGSEKATRVEKRGTISLGVIWPLETETTRRIPLSANSLVAKLKRLDSAVGVYVGEQTIPRPQDNITFDGRTFPYDAYVLEVTAHASTDGSGVAIASATIPVTIDADVKNLTITLAENIEKLEIKPDRTTAVNEMDFVGASPFNTLEYNVLGKSGAVNAVFPVNSRLLWSVTDTSRIQIVGDGIKTILSDNNNASETSVIVNAVGSTANGQFKDGEILGSAEPGGSALLNVTYDDNTNQSVTTVGGASGEARKIRVHPTILLAPDVPADPVSIDQGDVTTFTGTMLGAAYRDVHVTVTKEGTDVTDAVITESRSQTVQATGTDGVPTGVRTFSIGVTAFDSKEKPNGVPKAGGKYLIIVRPGEDGTRASLVREFTVREVAVVADIIDTFAGEADADAVSFPSVRDADGLVTEARPKAARTVKLRATLSGVTANKADVTWEILNAAGNDAVGNGDTSRGVLGTPIKANNSKVTTITYTAPRKIGVYRVRARSNRDDEKFDVVTLEVKAGTVDAVIQ